MKTRKMRNMKPFIKRSITLTVIFALILGTFTVTAKETEDYLGEIEQLSKLILDNYSGGDITEKELMEAAMDGMMSILDPYSTFFNDVEAKSFIDSLNSEYVGIGIRLEERQGKAIITEVFSGGSAAEAGVLEGDIITGVDGESATDVELNDLVSKIIGEEGTFVTMNFVREGESLTFEMERRKVFVPTVETIDFTENDYGLSEAALAKTYGVEVSSFADDTDEQFLEEVEKAKNAGAQYLLIDMRDNGGGYVTSTIVMLQAIAPEGVLVSFNGEQGSTYSYSSYLKEAPFTVVLVVNENSASASEIFAGAIKESGAGIVIGEQTYGKGVSQNIYEIGDTYMAKLTTNEFKSPEGNTINGIGITPDLIIDTPEYVYSDRRFFVTDTDEQIVNVESMLSFLGYFNEVPDDTYTSATYYAVADFQTATGLYSYGVCDFTTQARLNTEYRDAIELKDIQLEGAASWINEDIVQ